MNSNPNSTRRKAVRDAAAYTDAAIERSKADDEYDRSSRSVEITQAPELSTLSIEFEDDNKKFGYNEETLYGTIVKTQDGNIRVQIKAKIVSESDLGELNLQVSLID